MKIIRHILQRYRARPLLASLLLYQFIFLNIFLPGHNRGAITLDGKHVPDGVQACCCCCAGDSPVKTKSGPNDLPSRRDRDNCAICHFAARVMPTPAVNFVLPELGLLERLPPLAPVIPTHVWQISTYQSRGPPMGVND